MDNTPHTNVERLLSVVAIQQEIASAKLELGTVMDLVAERMPPLTGADGAAVELVEGDKLVYRAVSGTLSAHLGMRLEIDASISGLCVRTGEILRSDDTETDERVDRETCRRIGARSMIVVPLHHDHRTVGVLKVSSAKPGAFGEEEVHTLQLMTGLIAAGMSHTAQFEAEQALLEERTQALEKIQRSEERLRTIFEQSAAGIAEMDLDGWFALLNDKYCEITGYSREELLGMRMQDIIHPDDLPETLGLLERMSQEGSEFHIEKRYICKDGSVAWVNNDVSPRWDCSDSPAYAVVVVQDITDRKRREANTTFLEEVTEEITRLSSAGEIVRTAGAKIGAYLDLANCISVDVDETRGEGLVENIWSAEGMPEAPKAIRLSDYVGEDFYHASRAGETLVIRDTETDARTNARACRDLEIRSFVTVPFHGDGEWKYLLAVCGSRPREWREDEIELVRELANRVFPRLERARAEEAFRQSEQRFRLMVDLLPQAIWITDAGGRVEFFNKWWTDYTGVPYEPATAAEVAAGFVHPDDVPGLMEAFDEARRTGGNLEVEQRNLSASGEYRWFLNRAEPYRDPRTGEITQWFGVGIDIHDRKMAEEALRERESFISAVTESARVAIVIQELPGGGVVYANSYVRQLLGYEPEEMYAMSAEEIASINHPEDVDAMRALIEELSSAGEGELYWLEFRNRHKDGEYRWIRASATPFGQRDDHGLATQALYVCEDITERKHAEEALRQSEQRYRHLFEQSGELLLVHDGEGRIVDCNDQACAAHGYGCQEMLSMSIQDLTDTLLSEEETRLREASGGTLWQRVLAGEPARAEDTHIGEHVRKDGTRFPVEVRVSGIAYGEQSMILASLRDITERKRAEEEVRDALRETRQYSTQLQELRDVGLIISSRLSLDEVLRATTEQAREIVGAHQSVTSLTMDEGWSQSITSVSLSDKYADWRDYGEQPGGSGIYAEVCRANRPMRMTQEELEAHPAFGGFGRASEKHPPLRGWLAAPLIGRGGENIGLIQLSDRYEGEFTGTDEDILVQLAQMASVALENTQLYTEAREAEFRYRSLVEGLDAIVWEAKAPDLAFSFVSHRVEDILGYSPEKLLAEPGFLLSRIHPGDRPAAESFYEAAESGVESQEPVEYRVKSAAGREVWIRDEVRVIWDEDGSLVRLTGLMVDVTEIKRAEQALLEIREAERRRIARDLHDSVLQDISGALQTIQALQAERQSGGAEAAEDGLEQSLGALRQAVGGLREAIYDLRRDDERPLIHEVEALVELNRQMSPECGLTLHVEREFPRELPEAVSRELLRIVHEGLVNIRRHSGARRANVTLGAEGGEAWAGIFDDGRGFDQDEMPEGMGLSGMRERVAAMGGKLQVRSEPNRGTSVTMTIPLSGS